MKFIFEENHPEHGPYCWEMPSRYDYSKYKNKLTTHTSEWNTLVTCPHCHTPLSPYGSCQRCIEIWLKNMYKDLERS